MNWRHGGNLLRTHRVPTSTLNPALSNSNNQDANSISLRHSTEQSSVITSLSLSPAYIVVGLANHNIHVFSAKTGVLVRTLVGHQAGVWGVWLVSGGGRMCGTRTAPRHKHEEGLYQSLPLSLKLALGLSDQNGDAELRETGSDEDDVASTCSSCDYEPDYYDLSLDYSSPNNSLDYEDTCESSRKRKDRHSSYYTKSTTSISPGFGQPNSLVVSGGCDKVIKVWDLKTGSVAPFWPCLRLTNQGAGIAYTRSLGTPRLSEP